MTEADKLANAKAKGQAQFDSIVKMVERLHTAQEQAETSALSVEVRSDWRKANATNANTKPTEYRILLYTGDPAIQIRGTLSGHGEPQTARLEVQDWSTPWATFWPAQHEQTYIEATLLAYARCFWFGRGA
jgi:hypothetical protein